MKEHWHAELDASFLIHPDGQAGRDLRERLQAGLLLGVLGDNLRYQRARAATGWGLRLKEALWADVGVADALTHHRVGLMWFDHQGRPRQTPALSTNVALPYFQIARLPVTYAEWRAFVRASGYDPRADHWRRAGPAAQAWLQAKLLAGTNGRASYLPPSLDHKVWGTPNGLNPMFGVTVFEAVAYAVWASPMYKARQGQSSTTTGGCWQTRLPSDMEWEAAMRVGPQGTSASAQSEDEWEAAFHIHEDAQGRPARRSSRPTAFNHRATRWGKPSAVGVFSLSYGPGGQADVLGNVYEWCGNVQRMDEMAYDKYSQQASAPWNPQDGKSERAIRGGAFILSSDLCLPVCRNAGRPDDDDFNGVRLLRCWLP